METNSFSAVKDFIFAKLSKIEPPLPANKIEEEIKNTQTAINAVGPEMFAQILSVEHLSLLQPREWQQMQEELEKHFNVKFEQGVLIQGEEQQERDNTWWTSKEQQNRDNYYWNRYREYLKKSLSPEVIKTIGQDTDVIMNNIEDPSTPRFSRYGMVVGHVQSGKTANYAALVCKAADAGYNFIVVIAGGLNNLRDQTQLRMNESFVGHTKGLQTGSGKGNTDKGKDPISLTTVEKDFNKQDADRNSQGVNFDNIKVPILLVIKKHSKTLENVIEWLERQYGKTKIEGHAMLVIDDESDYASINTKKEESPTTINRSLRRLLALFRKRAYVAYTATPYANIFINHKIQSEGLGRDLFPKDFIYVLDAPTNYFGARKIYLDSDNRYLVPISDYSSTIPSGHKGDLRLNELPPSLKEAVQLFFINIAVRSLRNAGAVHNSMLIHVTKYTDVHRGLAVLVEEYIKELKDHVKAYGGIQEGLKNSPVLRQIKVTMEERLDGIEFTWKQVLKKMTETADTIVLREVHQQSAIPLEYRKDAVTNAVVVGGAGLSRGFTLEGLSVSYFLRTTSFYDTLMQMARWFGYRPGYEDICRIYMSQDKINDFADIIRATEELFHDFRTMAAQKLTPNDFGLAVIEDEGSALKVTARNKKNHVKNFPLDMRLDGRSKETAQLSKDPAETEQNIKAIKDLVFTLGEPELSNDHKIWRGIPRKHIQLFLSKFKCYNKDPYGLTSRMPIGFIQQYAKEKDTLWDVILYSGQGLIYPVTPEIIIRKEMREITVKEDCYEVKHRQVSSGNAESAIFPPKTRSEIGSDRSKARSMMTKPLLMLHFVEPAFSTPQDAVPLLPAFGVSFPGAASFDQRSSIRLIINTVYYENLVKQLEEEEDNDE